MFMSKWIDARKATTIPHQQRGQPVVAGVALGREPQQPRAIAPHLLDVHFRLLEPLEHFIRLHANFCLAGFHGKKITT